MTPTITIDRAGRVVIPKPIRDQLRLAEGTELAISAESGRIVLTPHTRAPAVVERDGRLALDLGGGISLNADHLEARDERLRELIGFALER